MISIVCAGAPQQPLYGDNSTLRPEGQGLSNTEYPSKTTSPSNQAPGYFEGSQLEPHETMLLQNDPQQNPVGSGTNIAGSPVPSKVQPEGKIQTKPEDPRMSKLILKPDDVINKGSTRNIFTSIWASIEVLIKGAMTTAWVAIIGPWAGHRRWGKFGGFFGGLAGKTSS